MVALLSVVKLKLKFGHSDMLRLADVADFCRNFPADLSIRCQWLACHFAEAFQLRLETGAFLWRYALVRRTDTFFIAAGKFST